jgi:1-acyl-sn-glycerol-3-phosphate acyltransferase
MLATGRPICRAFMALLYRLRVEGSEGVPREGPLIIISNHQSHYDPILIGLVVRNRPFRPMARSGLFNHWFMRNLLNAFNTISIDQSKGDMEAIRTSIDVVKSGQALIIYPEGTRTRDGVTHEFQRGFHVVMKRTRAPILPIAIEGAYDVWPIFEKWPRLSGRMVAKAGEVIPYDEAAMKEPDQLLESLRRKIETMRMELRAEIRRRSKGKYPRRQEGEKAYWEEE